MWNDRIEAIRLVDDPLGMTTCTVGPRWPGGLIWRFAQMILNGGELNGVRILSPQTVRFMGQDHLEPAGIPDLDKGIGFGLGFAIIRNQAAAGRAAAGYFISTQTHYRDCHESGSAGAVRQRDEAA